jgi:pimeloyl-ACP methyl ester carboxylesterase
MRASVGVVKLDVQERAPYESREAAPIPPITETPYLSRQISAGGLPLHALERGPSTAPHLLFLHGWLDHAHVFDWVCDALPREWHLVCLDFRGHGFSGHLPPGALYNFTDYLADVEATLDELKLAPVHLVGHSMGGGVAFAYAAARPDRVKTLTAIESIGSAGGPASNAVSRMRLFLSDLPKPSLKRTYASIEAAAARIQENNSSYTPSAALHMARFGTRPVAGGVQFTFDPAQRKRFGFSFDDEQVLAILGAIRCKVQILHGTSGFTFEDELMKSRLAQIGSPVPIAIPGGHHVQLDSPLEVAQKIEVFVRANR